MKKFYSFIVFICFVSVNSFSSELILEAHGGVVQFDTTSKFIEVPSLSKDKVDGNLTVEFWANISDLNSSTQSIISFAGLYGDSNETENTMFYVSMYDGNRTGFGHEYAGQENESIVTNYNFEQNKWYHFSFVRDDTNLTVYIDGVQIGSASYTNPPAAGENGKLRLGSTLLNEQGDSTKPFNGMIDEVRIWNIARVSQDINLTKNQQLDGNETGLLAYYNFDERIGDKVVDITSNSYDGIIDENVTRLNFLGDGLEFTTDYIETINNVVIPSGTISAQFWTKYSSNDPTITFLSSAGTEDFFQIYQSSTDITIEITDGTNTKKYRYNNEEFIANGDNMWHNYAFTFEQTSQELLFYIGGILQTVNIYDTNDTLTSFDIDNHIYIGHWHNDDNALNMTGSIAEVSLFNKALTQGEIKNNMHSSLKGDESGLVGYWPLNEGTGDTAYDKSSYSNNGTITGASWIDTAPTIYGDMIYTTSSISTSHKLKVLNNSSTPSYIYEGGLDSITYFNSQFGEFMHSSLTSGNNNVAMDASVDNLYLSTLFNIKNYSITTSITLNLTNIDLSEHNITTIKLKDPSEINSDIVFDTSSIANGTVSLNTTTINSGYYMILFTDTNDNTWYGNFTDGKLYLQADVSNDFITTIGGTTSSIDFSLVSSNFIISYITNPAFQLPIIEYKIDSTTYNNATPSDINMSAFYSINQHYDENNTKILNIMKIIPYNSKLIEKNIMIFEDGNISKVFGKSTDYNTSTNLIIFKNPDDIAVSEVKYVEAIDNSSLSSLYSDINNSIGSFPTNSIGYVFNEKHLIDECFIHTNINDTNSVYSSLDDFVTLHTFSNTANVLAYNHYDSSKALMFDTNANGIVEVDTTTGISTSVGSWEELNNISCTSSYDDATNTTINTKIIVPSVIKINLDDNINGYHNISYNYVGYNMLKGEYIEQDITRKVFFLNDIATKHLKEFTGLTSTPTLKYPITNLWTYLSLPTNITLCTDTFKNNSSLTSICNQEYSINNIFADVDLVLKYTEYWNYWDNTNDTYSMDKLSSINHKEGILIKSENTTTLSLPYDIFKVYPDTLNIYKKGWFLVGNQFKPTIEEIITSINSNSNYTVQYILRATNDIWEVYAPLNNSDVDGNLPRINEIKPMDGFWLYVK